MSNDTENLYDQIRRTKKEELERERKAMAERGKRLAELTLQPPDPLAERLRNSR